MNSLKIEGMSYTFILYILDYLSSLFDKGFQYKTINNQRPAISAYHTFIGGKPVRQHDRVCTLLTSVFLPDTHFILVTYIKAGKKNRLP